MTRTPEPEALRAGLLGPDAVELALSINGTEHTLTLEPREVPRTPYSGSSTSENPTST